MPSVALASGNWIPVGKGAEMLDFASAKRQWLGGHAASDTGRRVSF